MVEVFGKFYYIDVENLTEKCSMSPPSKDENGNNVLEINLFKYEVVKMCIGRILNEYDDDDDERERGVKNAASVRSLISRTHRIIEEAHHHITILTSSNSIILSTAISLHYVTNEEDFSFDVVSIVKGVLYYQFYTRLKHLIVDYTLY